MHLDVRKVSNVQISVVYFEGNRMSEILYRIDNCHLHHKVYCQVLDRMAQLLALCLTKMGLFGSDMGTLL